MFALPDSVDEAFKVLIDKLQQLGDIEMKDAIEFIMNDLETELDECEDRLNNSDEYDDFDSEEE